MPNLMIGLFRYNLYLINKVQEQKLHKNYGNKSRKENQQIFSQKYNSLQTEFLSLLKC